MIHDHDEVAMYLPLTNKLVSKNQRANQNYSRVVSPEVSKPNHAVMNKKQGNQMQFSLEKREWIHHTPCQPILPVDELIHQFYKNYFHLSQSVFMQWRN